MGYVSSVRVPLEIEVYSGPTRDPLESSGQREQQIWGQPEGRPQRHIAQVRKTDCVLDRAAVSGKRCVEENLREQIQTENFPTLATALKFLLLLRGKSRRSATVH